ncbi:hypothetical protein SASPL_141580 [Salvia splendens]|uniref:hAT-like transposase RNase-H fold domain-containing protein n=1 Tax=Salvia splendens TaxID=180675 RepID=A0A8X8ZCG4_SALSN|nr:hypothetical protein SASPL_141580 [Salvia splendens]
MDVKTRWNSTYKMLDIALKYRIVFERMAEECVPFIKYFRENDEKGRAMMLPSSEDWDNAKAFLYFLKSFYDLTLQLSASKTPMSHLIALSMFALQIEIEKKCGDSDFTLSKVAKAMKLKFEKYWEDWSKMNPLIFISNVLDPRNKLQMLKVSVKKLKVRSLTNVDQDQQLQHLCDRFKNDLVSLWGEYKGVNDTVLNQRPLLECEDVGDNIGQGGLYLFDELYNGVQEEIEQDQLNQISTEVDKYLADEMEKSDWLRAENFILYKDPIDDDLEFYREIEEIEKNQNMGQDASQVTPLLELILCLSQFTSTRIAIHNPLPNPL